jgi:hypothetical protein
MFIHLSGNEVQSIIHYGLVKDIPNGLLIYYLKEETDNEILGELYKYGLDLKSNRLHWKENDFYWRYDYKK